MLTYVLTKRGGLNCMQQYKQPSESVDRNSAFYREFYLESRDMD